MGSNEASGNNLNVNAWTFFNRKRLWGTIDTCTGRIPGENGDIGASFLKGDNGQWFSKQTSSAWSPSH